MALHSIGFASDSTKLNPLPRTFFKFFILYAFITQCNNIMCMKYDGRRWITSIIRLTRVYNMQYIYTRWINPNDYRKLLGEIIIQTLI